MVSTPVAVQAARTIGRRLSRNRAEQEDLASTAILGLLEYAQRNQLTTEEVLAQPHWRVLQSRALDRLRQQRRKRQHWRAMAAAYAEPRLQTAPLRDRLDCGRAIMRTEATLSAPERLILRRVYLGGEALAQVARDEGWTDTTARRRRAGLLHELRQGIDRGSKSPNKAAKMQPVQQ